jgi:hypothetical protein
MVLHHDTDIGRAVQPSAGGSVGVKVDQSYALTLTAHVSRQVGRYGAFTDATLLTGDQNFESRH